MAIHDRRALALGLALALVLSLLPLSRAESKIVLRENFRTFSFSINPTAAPESLLPTPPRWESKATLVGVLADAAEVAFEAELPRKTPTDKSLEHVAFNIAKIHHVSKTKVDGYMMALLNKRPDLAGLPFVLGDDCRQKDERKLHFNQAVRDVRSHMQQNVGVTVADSEQATRRAAEQFWSAFIHEGSGRRPDVPDHDVSARIAALMQVCGPQTELMRKGLVKYLAQTPHVEATQALARLAVFSAEDSVRQAALAALKTRREKDYTDILRQGLRYPLPAVAKRAGDALVSLERTDLVPELIALLDEADPRAPQVRAIDKQQVAVVRELVKINHHRNCLLCHAPGPLRQAGPAFPTIPKGFEQVEIRPRRINAPTEVFARGANWLRGARVDVLSTKVGPDQTETTRTVVQNVLVLETNAPSIPQEEGVAVEKSIAILALSAEDAQKLSEIPEAELSLSVRTLAKLPPPKSEPALPDNVATGAVPIPGMPMPSSENGYRSQTPDILVRLDVTYLRQDFSVMLPVADADPWPEMQRFDFLVRTRQLSEQDAQALRETIRKAGPSPYRQIAHNALRQLTGRDAEPNAEAWRRVLSKDR